MWIKYGRIKTNKVHKREMAFSKLNLNSGNLKQLNVNTLVHLYGGHTISGEAYAINHI